MRRSDKKILRSRNIDMG